MRVTQRPKMTMQQTEANDTSLLLRLTKRVLTEQGEQMACAFLFAVKPFFTAAEIMQIENNLSIRAVQGNQEAQSTQSAKRAGSTNDMQMLKMLMGMMGNGGKKDPMSILSMMGK